MQERDELVLVCPNSEELFRKLANMSLVVRVSSTDEIEPAHRQASLENNVRCIVVQESRPLSEVKLSDEWKRIPLALHVPGPGSVSTILRRISRLRDGNLRIFMPAAPAENLTCLRILSSLDVNCGLILEPPLDWDAVNDLMCYAMYTRTRHGDIDPFGYVRNAYNPKEPIYLRTPLFDNPLRYVHMDAEENIALSAADLRAGKLIGRGVGALRGLADTEEYRHGLNAWQSVFMDDKHCAYCPVWRLCQGAFLAQCGQEGQVLRFFQDFLAAADAACSAHQAGARWQP